MLRAFLILSCLALAAGGVHADPSNLASGALVAHYVPELGYSSDPPPVGDWCLAYEEYAIHSFDEQINRIDVVGTLPASWYVLAGWTEEKVWCVTEFGFGDFDPALFYFAEYDPCFPPDGGLEIPTPGWPGPNEGIAFAVTGEPWAGNLVPVMWFGGYAYEGEGVIPLHTHPQTGFAGFANCLTPPELWEAGCLGGMGINLDGIYCEPITDFVVCCLLGGECLLFPPNQMEECLALGGEWYPEWHSCDPNPCIPTGVCCFETGECFLLLPDECDMLGGFWLQGYGSCDPNPCPQPGVCCLDDHTCLIFLYQQECDAIGGHWHPEWQECDPNPCTIYSPTRPVRWGTIKALYQ